MSTAKTEENSNTKKKNKKKEDIPEPVPNKTTKDTAFKDIDFTIVDQHAISAPKSLLNGTFWELIQYLTGDDVFDDLVRVRAIYRWITSFDVDAVDVGQNPQPDTPIDYFSKIQCDMGNLANLFYILCTMAEIPCQVIDGISKNGDYVLGGPEVPEMRSQWNAVYIKKEWRLLDIFWAKECLKIDSGDDDDTTITTSRTISRTSRPPVEDADEEYFFTDAEHLIWTHFPDEVKWQLLKEPITKEEFINNIYVRERSREMGITFPMMSVNVPIVDGQGRFELNFPPKRGVYYHFKHNFIRMIPAGDTARKLDKVLHHFILYERHESKITFMFNIPILGKFRVNVFANDPSEVELSKFDMICSFVVICDKLSKECLPLPDYPLIGWGPNKLSRRLKLVLISHEESSIHTDTGVLEIVVGGKQELKMEMKLVNSFVDNANMSKYAMIYWNKGNYIVKTRLPQSGLYGLKFYIRNESTMEQKNVLNYLIHCNLKNGKAPCLPHIAQDNLGPNASIGQLGIMATTFQNGYIETKDGRANIKFATNNDVELVGELHSNDPEAIPRMRVQQERQKRGQAFEVDCPVKGEYGFNVYAFRKDDPHKLNNAYAFLVNSDGRKIDVGTLNNKTIEKSKNFWKNTTEIKVKSIITQESDISVPVPRDIDNLIAFLQKTDKSEPQSSSSIQKINEKGVDIYKVNLEDNGDYIFNIYQKHQTFLRLVSRYVITRKDTEEELEPSAKEVLEVIKEEREKAGSDVTDLEQHINESRIKSYVDVDGQIVAAQKLNEALETNDFQAIRRALTDYQKSKPDDKDALLTRAQNVARKLEAKYDLLRAYKCRELTNLERAIASASSVNLDRSFDLQLVHAKRLRDRLAALRTMQDIVQNTDNRVVSEIRQYVSPPIGVHQTIMAALLLLGYPLYRVETWPDCQHILSYQGKQSFLSTMSTFDPKDVNLDLAIEAKKTIELYTAKQIHKESHEAAAIFMWVDGMIREIESNAGTLGVQKVVPRNRRAKTEINKPVKKKPPQPPVKKKPKPAVTVTLSSLIDDTPIPPASPRKKFRGTNHQKQFVNNQAVKSINLGKSPSPMQKSTIKPNKINMNVQSNVGVNNKNSSPVDSQLKKIQGNITKPQLNKGPGKSINQHTGKTDLNTTRPHIVRGRQPSKDSTPRDQNHSNETQRDNNAKSHRNDDVRNPRIKRPHKKAIDKAGDDFDDSISSYLSDFKKKQDQEKSDGIIDDENTHDGLSTIPESGDLMSEPQHNGYMRYVPSNPYESIINDFHSTITSNQNTPDLEPENEDIHGYKSLFNKRKENQVAMEYQKSNSPTRKKQPETPRRKSIKSVSPTKTPSVEKTPEPHLKDNKCYQDIYVKRKEEKENLERLWAKPEKVK